MQKKLHDYLSENEFFIENIPEEKIKEAILIRVVEQKFLELFSLGELNGTVHTCVGQEFSAVAIAGKLTEVDWITSNHRCHGHFIAKTKNWKNLVSELLGTADGVCKGIGSSQHLYTKGFLSNGIQGSLLPVATGIALDKKQKNEQGIVVSFLGEGTLGEGIFYETLNLASLLKISQLFVCENNSYSQSTSQQKSVAGEIIKRPEAFNIKTFMADTWDLNNLFLVAEEAIAYVRQGNPAFLLIKTYRLNPHSKGDDNRDISEINFYKKKDRLNIILEQKKWQKIQASIEKEINNYIETSNKTFLRLESYLVNQFPSNESKLLVDIKNDNIRMVKALNNAYLATLKAGAIHLGEDIEDPYGGAFKVTKGFSTLYPQKIIGTPISEAAIVGIGIGLALRGTHSFVEIMFGDFMGLCFDQILNNASKMYHMYAFQVAVPVRIRTPMGGKRGYGPTHSQSLEKFFLGIDNVAVIALTSLIDPKVIIPGINKLKCPILIIENKTDYAKFLWQPSQAFILRKEKSAWGNIVISPKNATPTVTFVSYGETARMLADNLELLFEELDLIPELICLTALNPLNTDLIEISLQRTKKLVTIEDGSIDFGIGSEMFAILLEKNIQISKAIRLGAYPVPIPSTPILENKVLPTIETLISQLKTHMQ